MPATDRQNTADQTEPHIQEPRRFRYGTSSLVLDEAELRRAGIRNYRVEIKSCTNGNWKVLYNKTAVITPRDENSQEKNNNKWVNWNVHFYLLEIDIKKLKKKRNIFVWIIRVWFPSGSNIIF